MPARLSEAEQTVSFLAASSASVRNFAIDVNGAAVGNVGISAMEDRHGTGWIYFWLSTEARGRGVAAIALATVADWAFERRGLFRLELGHRTNNPASCAVAQRAGFLAEGIERRKLRYGAERFDVETHARLATDARSEIPLLAIAAG